MKILFVMRSTVYLRNFESMLRLAAKRGHCVHVVADPHPLLDPKNMVSGLTREYTNFTHSPALVWEPNGWLLLGETLRRGVDYLRYLDPIYQEARKLRFRAARTAPPFVTRILRWPLMGSRPGMSLLGRLLRLCDRALPRHPAVDAFVQRHAPDLLLVTPLVEPGSPQAAYLRSARALGIPTGLCVYSWDNLTNKGLIQDPLDIVTLWNESMKKEAVELHGVPPDRVVVTGAAAYDQWFTWKPQQTRDAFCARVGLRSDRPYILYVASSRFVAPDEAPFVCKWVQQLRESSGVLRNAGVLVRPHPQNAKQWKGVDLHDLSSVSVWPPAGCNPVDSDAKAEYYDSIYHSVAVVGVNTSAQIESAIVGRRVYTLLAKEFLDTQEGTLHFRHLARSKDGLLCVARNFAEHIAQLETGIASAGAGDQKSHAFLESFVRPFGLHVPAAPRLVDALEAVAARPRRRVVSSPGWAFLVRPLLALVAAAYERTERDRWETLSQRETKAQLKAEALAARRAAKTAARDRAREQRRQRALRRSRERAKKAAAQTAKLELRRVEAAEAFENYRTVRAHVVRMKKLDTGKVSERSTAEQRMLSAVRHMWNASPEVIAKLREHCKPITGTSPASYEGPYESRKAFFLDLSRLRKVGNPALLVPEAPLLGGFGFAAHSPEGEQLYNDDTLKFYEVLSALECGAVLDTFRSENGRQSVVWEIGGAWGGFAYQFKTLFPNVTYVITAPAELLLFSAVYLMTAFPNARYRFYGDESPGAFWHDLKTVDFAFATVGALAERFPDRAVDLTLDLQALEHMPPECAQHHVQDAFDLGSRYFYSLGPRTNQCTPDRTAASTFIKKLYWAYELPVPQFDGMEVLTGFRGHGPADGGSHAHRIGWQRILV